MPKTASVWPFRALPSTLSTAHAVRTERGSCPARAVSKWNLGGLVAVYPARCIHWDRDACWDTHPDRVEPLSSVSARAEMEHGRETDTNGAGARTAGRVQVRQPVHDYQVGDSESSGEHFRRETRGTLVDVRWCADETSLAGSGDSVCPRTARRLMRLRGGCVLLVERLPGGMGVVRDSAEACPEGMRPRPDQCVEYA